VCIVVCHECFPLHRTGTGNGHFGVVRGLQRDLKRVRIDVYLRILVRLSLSCSELRLDDRPKEYILMTGDLDGEVIDDGGSGDGFDRIRGFIDFRFTR
jgi:hypothetical protein